jgi:hypothetical protein
MKRRIIVLGVLILSFFALTQPNSVARSSSNAATVASSDCASMCADVADSCYTNCDETYFGYPAMVRQCYDQCFWEYENCMWGC